MSEKPPRRASEMLMQRYYRAAKGVTQVNTILLLTLEATIFPGADAAPVIINERFQKRGEWLEAKMKMCSARSPPRSWKAYCCCNSIPT